MEQLTNLLNRLIVWNNPFRVDAPLTEKPGGSFAQAETELPQSEILSKDAGPFLLSSSGVLLTFLLYIYFYL